MCVIQFNPTLSAAGGKTYVGTREIYLFSIMNQIIEGGRQNKRDAIENKNSMKTFACEKNFLRNVC